MAKKGVSARAVSKAIGIPQSTYQGLLDGNREPSVAWMPSLAAYFECSIEFLLTGNDSAVTDLNKLLTEEVFDGLLRVKIERVITKK